MGLLFHEVPVWSPLGYTPESMQLLRKLPPPEEGGPTLSEVWAEWNRIHRATTRKLGAMPISDSERALSLHLGHFRRHVEVIERLIRQAAKRPD
jgi:hypothetical protein